MSRQKLKAISGKLKKASKAHASQAKQIDSMLKMKKKPSKNTLDSMVRPFDMSEGSEDAKKLNKIFEPKKKKEVKIGNTTYTVSDKKQSTMKLRRFPKGSKGHQKRKEKVKKFIETGVQKSINLVNKIRKSPTSVATGLAGLKKQSTLKKKTSPALAKLSASCKAAAKRKFKVYPSAYANMWAAKTQRQGKC